jgi:hypothetical protein
MSEGCVSRDHGHGMAMAATSEFRLSTLLRTALSERCWTSRPPKKNFLASKGCMHRTNIFRKKSNTIRRTSNIFKTEKKTNNTQTVLENQRLE